jgi:RNA polymerase sigma factor (sigma-70 family)
LDERTFIDLIAQGDNYAFSVLVNDYKNKIFNTTLGIVQHYEDAEDITQEIFIEIFQSIVHFKGESKLSTWIYRITITKSLEFLRKKKRKKRFAPILFLFSKNNALQEINKNYFYHPGVDLENKERAAILFKAIDKLAENQKTAFLLHKTEQLSYNEIAEIMQITIPSVESLMFRAKQNLQKLLGDYYEKNEK